MEQANSNINQQVLQPQQAGANASQGQDEQFQYYYDKYFDYSSGDQPSEGFPPLEQVLAKYSNKAENLIAQRPIIEAIIKQKQQEQIDNLNHGKHEED